MDVCVWKRIAAKDDVFHFAKSNVRPIPNRAQEDVVEVLIESRGDNHW